MELKNNTLMKSRLFLLISLALVAASMSATKQQLQQAFDRIAGSNYVRSNSMYNGIVNGKNTNMKVWKFKIPSDRRELFDNTEAAFANPGDAYFKTDSRDGSNQAFLISCGDSQKVTVGGKDKNVIVGLWVEDNNKRIILKLKVRHVEEASNQLMQGYIILKITYPI